MSSKTTTSKKRADIVVCKCGYKARYVMAKSEMNRSRLYSSCPNFNRENTDEQLYLDTLATLDTLKVSKLHRKQYLLEQSLEDVKADTHAITKENKVLRGMAFRKGLGEQGVVVDGELIFKRKDAVLEDLDKGSQ